MNKSPNDFFNFQVYSHENVCVEDDYSILETFSQYNIKKKE
ncbi:hypothetical protein IGI37_001796 [Enterococcus sp. AZ194]